MRSSIVASVLSKLTTGGRAEVTPEEAEAFPSLMREGLMGAATVDPEAAPRLARLRAELVAARGTDREAALREAILALSDVMAEASGGVEIIALGDGGAYRGAGQSVGTYHLTQKGRALLSDLGPRAPRVGAMSLADFQVALDALKRQMGARTERARVIMTALGNVEPRGAARLAALGAAARREPTANVAFYLSEAHKVTTSSELTPNERWSCAESAVLAVGQLEHARPIAQDLIKLRNSLFAQYAHGRSEDALDAAVMLLPWPEAERARAIERAAGLATYFRTATNAGLPLANALVIERTRTIDELLSARLVSMYRELSAQGLSPDEAAVTSALLSLSEGDAGWLVARTGSLSSYLGRFSPTPLWGPAAALSLLQADVPEILDDVRLASAAVQRDLLASSGAEAIGLAIKLLLLVADLGHGQEGDAEEQLPMRPEISAAAHRLGLAGLTTSLPTLLVASAAFHRPLLTAHDVALAAAPMHDSYVFGTSGWGSGWSSGWGSSSWGSGHRHYGGSRGWG